MGQQTLDGADLSALRAEYDQKVHEALPARAKRDGDWPIQLDHCFGRVVLDNLCEDVWDDEIDGRPAYKSLSRDDLERAIEIADRMLTKGRPVVTELNENSLRWRSDE
ncbi:MAG: hypothetical protein ABEI27_03490 [Halobellus sp.]|uniref:hypothetical protein n=1 Tax=Halobellus sp. TaxID=1979212 RepID=UPI0035D459B4